VQPCLWKKSTDDEAGRKRESSPISDADAEKFYGGRTERINLANCHKGERPTPAREIRDKTCYDRIRQSLSSETPVGDNRGLGP